MAGSSNLAGPDYTHLIVKMVHNNDCMEPAKMLEFLNEKWEPSYGIEIVDASINETSCYLIKFGSVSDLVWVLLRGPYWDKFVIQRYSGNFRGEQISKPRFWKTNRIPEIVESAKEGRIVDKRERLICCLFCCCLGHLRQNCPLLDVLYKAMNPPAVEETDGNIRELREVLKADKELKKFVQKCITTHIGHPQ